MSENWENTGSRILFFGYGLNQFSPREKVATREAFLGVGGGGGGSTKSTKRGTYVAIPFAILHRSFNLFLSCLSPFHLSYVAVSSSYRFSEFCFKQGLAKHNTFSSSVNAIIFVLSVQSFGH